MSSFNHFWKLNDTTNDMSMYISFVSPVSRNSARTRYDGHSVRIKPLFVLLILFVFWVVLVIPVWHGYRTTEESPCVPVQREKIRNKSEQRKWCESEWVSRRRRRNLLIGSLANFWLQWVTLKFVFSKFHSSFKILGPLAWTHMINSHQSTKSSILRSQTTIPNLVQSSFWIYT